MFPALLYSAEARVIRGDIVNHLLTHYFIGSISAKKCQNQFTYIKDSEPKVGSFFWATIGKTVRPTLSDRCLSVTFMHCGQTVGPIKMKLGMPVGLSPGHIVLDGDPAPPPLKGHSPQFSTHICCGQMAGWINM